MKKSDLALLSANDLNAVGIKTELSQNDLVEVVFGEKYNELRKRIESLKTKAEDLEKEIVDNKNQQISKVKEKYAARYADYINENSEVSLNPTLTKYRDENSYGLDIVYPIIGRYGRESFIKATYITLNEPVKVIANFQILNSKIIGKAEEKTYLIVKDVKVDIKPLLGIEERIKEHSQEVGDFIDQFKGINIDEEAFLRRVKITINKNLIKAASPQIREQINNLFGVNI